MITFEIFALSAVVLFVLYKLYSVLGKDVGLKRSPAKQTNRAKLGSKEVKERSSKKEEQETEEEDDEEAPIFTGPAASGLTEIYAADKNFSSSAFMSGAKDAYEMLVEAFNKGDRDTFRPFLDDVVYAVWDEEITRREKEKETPLEFSQIRVMEIEEAAIKDGIARIWVRFDAELLEGAREHRTSEVWVFRRDVTQSNPNWILDDVEPVT